MNFVSIGIEWLDSLDVLCNSSVVVELSDIFVYHFLKLIYFSIVIALNLCKNTEKIQRVFIGKIEFFQK